MDYRLYIDSFTQLPRIKVESEHAAFGDYLSEEMADDQHQLQLLIRRLHREESDWFYQGKEWQMRVEDGAVSINHHSQLADDEVELPDEMLNTERAELSAECGREDFVHLLESWLAYLISNK